MGVFAAESVLSPLADNAPIPNNTPETQPSTTFGQLVVATPTPLPQELITTPSVTPTPSSPQLQSKKKSYSIALLGDSMIDTLGPGVPLLKQKLQSLYPTTSFTLLNYGAGGTNIDYGIERLTHGYTYLGNQIPPLVLQHPDMVVVESFGYNPYPVEQGALDKHWLQLASIVTTLRQQLPDVAIVIAATIAPNDTVFGDGAPGISFTKAEKLQRTAVIKKYLENAVRFAQSQHLPLADAYHASLDGGGNGILSYINQGDHIHYSDTGRALFSQKVADAIVTNHLLE